MKYQKIILLLGLLLFVTISCQPHERELAFKSFAHGEIINYWQENPALFIIASNDEIDVLASSVLVEDPDLVNELQELDYDDFFAILVLQGQKGSTGYSITIKQIIRENSQVKILVKLVESSPGDLIKPAFTSPYHLVAVSKRGEWGQLINFVLVADSEEVAETSHFIP